MNKIVFMGGSLAGVKAAEEIRLLDPASTIKILLWEPHLPYFRSQFASFLGNEISADKLAVRDRGFYEQNHIEILTNKKISRVNFRKGQITFEDKEKLDYDVLVLTDTPHTKLPDVKGNHRNGVFGLRRMSDALEISKLLPVVETVVIQSQTLAGLRIAASLRRCQKEVIWVTPEKRILSGVLNEEALNVVRNLVEEAGVRLVEDNEIAEVLGDTEAKAFRLKSGKVLAAQLVLWPDAGADLKLFKESELQCDEKIPVNAQFQTNISNVFALDDLCQSEAGFWPAWGETYSQVLEQQAKALAACLNGQGMVAEYPVCAFTGLVGPHKLQMIGQTLPQTTTEVLAAAEPEHNKFRQLLIENDIAVGAVLVNCENERERFARLIRERCRISQETNPLPGNIQRVVAEILPGPVMVTEEPVAESIPQAKAVGPV